MTKSFENFKHLSQVKQLLIEIMYTYMIEIKKIRVSGKIQNTISITSLTIDFQYIFF